jgi:hypothetical protein
MSYNSNFDVTATIANNKVNVTGTSQGDYNEDTLVSRHIILQQGKTLRLRQAQETTQGVWKVLQPMSAEGFKKGEALALGSETYYIKRDGAPATFITQTWSQSITIQ